MEHRKQQNSCYICLNKDSLCSSNKIVMNSEILQLLKFLIVNVNIEALENVVVGRGCLKKIIEACEYKYKNLTNSSEILKDKMIKSDSKESIICLKCETVFQNNDDAFRLVDCVRHIDWLDFVNYLFKNPNLEYLENSHICNSCRISMINIQHILKLLIKASSNKVLTESEVEVKEEIESNDLIKNEQIHNDYVSYENFKLKNEEIDLKFDSSDCDNTDTDHGCEKVQKEYEVNYPEINNLEEVEKCNFDGISSHIKKYEMCHSRGSANNNAFNCHSKTNVIYGSKKLIIKLNLDDDIAKKTFLMQHNVKNNSQIFKCQHCTHEAHCKSDLTKHIKSHKNIKAFKCVLCSKTFFRKIDLDNHLLRIHECRDVRKKLYKCNKCNYECLMKKDLLKHKIKHGITDDIPILKCNQCAFETYHKSSFIKHKKIHEDIKDFKCSYCSKEFTYKINLDRHLLKIHKCKDVKNKIYNCGLCSCDFITKKDFLDHKIKHGITDNIPILKCHQCTFETYRKSSLYKHVKIHQNIKDFTCKYCSKEFTYKSMLKSHLLKVKKCRGVSKKTA